jgi:uncharacterized protein (TIGR02246 family)
MRFVQVTCFLFAAISLAACAAGPMRHTSDTTEIESAVQRWVAAYNSRDPARITAQYAPDAVLWGTGSKEMRSSAEAIADYFKNSAKRPAATVRVDSEVIRPLTDEAALAVGSYTFGDSQQGASADRPSRFTFVFVRRDGRWAILHHHSSAMPAR